jgi:hypothetical protein
MRRGRRQRWAAAVVGVGGGGGTRDIMGRKDKEVEIVTPVGLMGIRGEMDDPGAVCLGSHDRGGGGADGLPELRVRSF